MSRQLRRLADLNPDPHAAEWQAYRRERRQSINDAFRPAEEPELGWIVEGFLPIGYLAVLAGRPKDGK